MSSQTNYNKLIITAYFAIQNCQLYYDIKDFVLINSRFDYIDTSEVVYCALTSVKTEK